MHLSREAERGTSADALTRVSAAFFPPAVPLLQGEVVICGTPRQGLVADDPAGQLRVGMARAPFSWILSPSHPDPPLMAASGRSDERTGSYWLVQQCLVASAPALH